MSLVDRLTDDRLELMLAERARLVADRARMVQDIATARGLSVEQVEVHYALPPIDEHLHPCSHGALWPSAALAAECPCDPTTTEVVR